jgi:hypothetical protein
MALSWLPFKASGIIAEEFRQVGFLGVWFLGVNLDEKLGFGLNSPVNFFLAFQG